MPRRSLVPTVRLSQWNTRSWTPLVPARRLTSCGVSISPGAVVCGSGTALAVGIAAVVAGSSRADEPAPPPPLLPRPPSLRLPPLPRHTCR